MAIDFSKIVHADMRDHCRDAEALATLIRYCFAHSLTLTINPYRNASYDDVVVRFDKTIGDKTYRQAAAIKVTPTMDRDHEDFFIKQTCHQVVDAIEHDLLNKYGKEADQCSE